jgi:RimJ/RimL family protein N-acetyltransferase
MSAQGAAGKARLHVRHFPRELMDPILHTERLSLTPMQVSDFEDLARLWSTEAFTQWLMPAPLSAEDVWMRLLRDLGHWQALGHGNWAVRLRETGAFAGSVGILDYRRELAPAIDAPELGWGIAPTFQGQGIAFEAVSAALEWAERRLQTRRTVCLISTDNGPSHRLAERLGYRPYAQTTYKSAASVLLERRAET